MKFLKFFEDNSDEILKDVNDILLELSDNGACVLPFKDAINNDIYVSINFNKFIFLYLRILINY